jgi:hypothetical protein
VFKPSRDQLHNIWISQGLLHLQPARFSATSLEQSTHDFAASSLRQFIYNHNLSRLRNRTNLFSNMFFEVLSSKLLHLHVRFHRAKLRRPQLLDLSIASLAPTTAASATAS